MAKYQIFLLPIFFLSFLFILRGDIQSSSLEIASDQNFARTTEDFTAGQTIYVQIKTDNDGKDKRQLNLRDNQFGLLNSYTLSKNGDKFWGSLVTPQTEGYYSLEAQIESGGNVTTSVKTIRVGSPANASVQVNIKSQVQGQIVSTTTSTPKSSPTSTDSDQQVDQGQNTEVLSESDYSFDQHSESPKQKQGVIAKISEFFKKLAEFIWPF